MSDTHKASGYRIGEVATMLGVSVDTIRRWEQVGDVTSIRSAGGQRRFTQEQVEHLTKTKARGRAA